MALGNSTPGKRVDNPRIRARRKKKSKKNDPGLLGSMLSYLAQEAHSFVTNLSGVNEGEEEDLEEDSEEDASSNEDMEGTESLVEDYPISPHREIETRTLARPKDVAARRDRPHDYHDDLPQSAGAGPSRVVSRATIPSRSKKLPNDPSNPASTLRLRPPLMPGSLFPRSPSPDASQSLKHVHFTPPACKKPKSTHGLKPNICPEDVPLPRSRSSSPDSNHRVDNRPTQNNSSEQRIGHRSIPTLAQELEEVAHRISSSPRLVSRQSNKVPVRYAESYRDRVSSTESDNLPSADALNIDYDLRRTVSVESMSVNPGPPSTIMAASEEPSTTFSRKGKERTTENHSFDTSTDSNISEDKARIQLLEAEIERLRAELATRNQALRRQGSSESLRPPPPPPPPPPLPSGFGTKMPVLGGNLPYGNVRANLRHQNPPVEKPIVSIGKPTVAPAHMQAFLSELKTVRLRKTNSANIPPSERSFQFSRAADTSIMANRTWSAGDEGLFASRKRPLDGTRQTEPPTTKRKLTNRVNDGLARSQVLSSRHHDYERQPSQTTSTRASADVPPSLTAPSLSSDERDVPDTPRSPFPDPHLPTHEQTVDEISGLPSKPSFHKPWSKDSSVFEHARRLPTSPINSRSTPKKPKPPSRQRASARPRAYFPQNDAENDSTMQEPHPAEANSHYNARHRSPSFGEMRNGEDAADLEESDTLTGVGARDQRGGFLARGGAGGEPIFMGEGYVKGYNSQPQPPSRAPSKARRTRKS